MSTLLNPYFGEFGGMYVPQILMPALRQLEEAFVSAQKDPAFQAEFTDLLKNYAGRPTALTKCRNLTDGTRTTLYLKRESAARRRAQKPTVLGGLCWPNGWAKPKLSPRPAPASTASPQPWPAPCSA